MLNRVRLAALTAASALSVICAAAPASAQADILLQLRTGSPASDRFRVDSAGGVVAIGRVGYGIIPASGEGVRMMWHPYKGSLRVGAASAAGEFDEGNIGFYSFAGGNRTIANDFASFAFGDQVTVTGASATGFGGNNTVDGNFGFSAGSQNRCVGFVCTSIGFTANASGQGAFALGYRTTADADYSFALGRMASTNGFTGAFVWGDASINDSVQATANNQFTVRARGGIRLRTSTATGDNVGVNANTGCDIAGNSGVMSCASSRTLKEHFVAVGGEDVLTRIRRTPVTTWNYIGEEGNVRHMGPVAEDFHAAFGLGTNNTTIGHLDIDGVNFAGVKALEERTAKLQQDVADRDRRISDLEARVARLEQLLTAQPKN
ncbi:MAG TPA: tail fiber domain-containing protein [Longimicrobium sp.]